MNGIASTIISWRHGAARLPAPPRLALAKTHRGSTLGKPGDSAQQRRILEAGLGLLAENAPVKVLHLDEQFNG